MNKKFLKTLKILGCVTLIGAVMIGCGKKNKEEILIYASTEDYKIEHLDKRLQEEFPDYEITIEYLTSGNSAAKLMSEGTDTACDIVYSLEYGYLESLDKEGIFADLSHFDTSIYVEDAVQSGNYLPEGRSGGGIIVNTKVLEEKGLEKPQSYQDLLKEEYKGLISMPNPKSSSTGYMFLKSLVNAWGEEEAFSYFDNLTPNILQYTSSGSGPVNALVQEEAAIGLGMTGQAVTQINEGAPLEVLFFEEGSPHALYGHTIIKGKETRDCVQEVYQFIVEKVNYEIVEKFFPEKIYADIDFEIENYPQNIVYSDMSNNGSEEKERLLELWKY